MKLVRAIDSFFDRLYKRPFGRLLLSLLMVGGVFLFAFYIMEPAYLTNDDTNIAFTLAGYRTGTPYAAHPFINIVLGFLISRLYGLFPAVPWWFAAQELAMLLSGVVLSLCTLRALAKRNVHWLLACMLFGVLYVGLLFRPIVRVSFTLTACALGTAAVALLFSYDREDAKATRLSMCLLSGALLIAAFLFRNSSGISLACFYFAAILYRLLDAKFHGKAERKVLLRRTGAFAFAMVLLVGAVIGVNQFALNACNEAGYMEFDEARADFVDYRRTDPYAVNPSLYASVGWDEPLYNLALHWCFMDERVTTDALTALAASSASASEPLSERIADIPARFRTFWSEDYFARLMSALPSCALIAGVILLVLTKRRDPLPFVLLLCTLLGAILLVSYLAFNGRLILRTFRLILAPASFSAALLAARILPLASAGGTDAPAVRRSPRNAVSAALCLLLLLFGGLMSGRALVDTLRSDYTDEIAVSRAVIRYCIEHPDEIFIRDTSTGASLDALATYPEEKPTNLLSWGDTDMLTGAQKAQLDLLGLSAPLRMDAFRREDVRFVGTPGSGAYRVFADYAAARLDASLVQTDTIGTDIGVFRLVFEGNAS